jgi:hypothetical protein
MDDHRSYGQAVDDAARDKIWEDLEAGEPCKDSNVYTASRLSEFSECPMKYWLHNVKGFRPESRHPNAIRGTAIHGAINRIHRLKKFDDWLDIFEEEKLRAMADPHEVDLPWARGTTEESVADAMEDGAVMLGGYVERNRTAEVVASEVQGRMLVRHPRTKTKYRFAMTIDQVRRVGKSLKIVDLKTGKNVPNPAYLARSLQFTGYGAGLKNATWNVDGEWQSFGEYPESLSWYQLGLLLPYKRGGKRSDGSSYQKGDVRGDPEIPVVRDLSQYEEFPIVACRIIQAIRMKLFYHAVNWFECGMCKFESACSTGSGMTLESDPEALADLSTI